MTTSYTAGTVSVTAGSDIVTGVGTGWQSANIAPGYFGLDSSNGNPIPVAEIISDTQMRLFKPWRGTTAAGQGYWLSYDTRDGQQTVNNAQRLAEYVAMLNKPSLAALGALTPAANTFPWFPTPTTAEAASITAFGRNWVAALNSSAAYGVLGEIPNAQLPTRLRGLSTAVADADLVIESGFYTVEAAALNIPIPQTGMLLVNSYRSNIGAFQIYVRATGGDMWCRGRTGGTWGTWYRIPNFGTDNIIPDASLPPQISQFPGTATRPADADDFRRFGVVQVTNETLNLPVATAGVLLNVPYDNGTLRQIFFPNNATTAYHRRRAGSWLGWTRFDGDLSGPGAAVVNNAFVGFNGTSGFAAKQLTTLEAIANLGPVLGGSAPEPNNAGVGMTNGDFDTMLFPGVYTIAGNWNNGPLAPLLTHTGILEVQARTYNNMYVQIFRLAGGNVYKRVANQGPAWQPWVGTENAVPATTVAGRFVQFSDVNASLQEATIPTATILGRTSAGTGIVESLTAAQARTVIGVAPTAARQVRIGAQGDSAVGANAWFYVPASNFITGLFVASDYTVRNVTWRPVQQTNDAGTWVTVAQS